MVISTGCYFLPDKSEDSPYEESYMRQYLEKNPGMPSLLPERLPGYVRFMGHESTHTENGKAVLRSALFGGDPFTAAPVQVMCVEVRSSRSRCLAKGERRKSIHRNQGSLRITVTIGNSVEMPEGLIEFWESVPLSSDLNNISWLQ